MTPPLSFLLLLLSSVIVASSSQLETFQINLDLAPEDRWKDVITAKKDYIQEYTQMMFQQLQTQDIASLLSNIESGSYFEATDFSREMQGIAQYSGLTYSQVFLVNFMYEAFAACTSIVYENTNGEVVLGHNLDYFFTVPMGHSIVLLEFYKGGNIVYKAQSVAGQIGFFTALKSNGYALTLNQRSNGVPHDLTGFLQSLFKSGVYPVIYNMRLSLEKTEDFEGAVEFLSNVQLGSKCYFILSGTEHNQGIVITRNPNDVYDSTRLNTEQGQWFLVQTNSDRDLPNYAKIDVRRYQAETRVASIGRDAMSSGQMMNNVLSLSPNKNSITILSSFLSAQNGDFETTMWV